MLFYPFLVNHIITAGCICTLHYDVSDARDEYLFQFYNTGLISILQSIHNQKIFKTQIKASLFILTVVYFKAT